METPADKLNHLSEIVALISHIYASKSGFMSGAEHDLLMQSLAASAPQRALGFNEALTMYHDVIYSASQVYKDRPAESLSGDEQALVCKLQAGGFLTKDPDHVSPTAG